MPATPFNPAVIWSAGIYARLLRCYPRNHQAEYGPVMLQLFRDQCRDAWRESPRWGLPRLWLRVLPDLLKSSFTEHLANLRQGKSMNEKTPSLLRSRTPAQSLFLRVFAVGFLLVLGLTIALTYLLPETYMSIARIKVDKTAGTDATTGPVAYDPYFIQTEFEVIQSQVVLNSVIENLKLNDVWGKKYAGGAPLKTTESYALLKRRIDLRPVRNTSLIEIRAYDEDPREAAAIANEIASVYRDFRNRKSAETAYREIDNLANENAKYEHEIAATRDEMDNLRAKFNISSADAAGDGPAPAFSQETLMHLETARVDAESRYLRDANLLTNLRAKSRDDLKNILPTLSPDTLLNNYMTDLGNAESKLVSLKQTQGVESPELKATAAVVADLTQKVNDRVTGILMGLEAKVDSEKTELASFTDQIDKARRADWVRAQETRPFYAAKRQLQSQQNYADLLASKIALAKMDRTLHQASQVDIVDQAEPAFRPARPNKPLLLTSGTAGAMAVGLLAGLFSLLVASWFRPRLKPALP